jgi:hypothetical protein
VGDIVLEIGAVTEAVTVAAQGATVQTASAERAGVVTTSQLDSLLIRGRNVMSVLQTLPGIVDTGGSDSLTNAWSINAQGSRTNTNNIALDGATLSAIGNMKMPSSPHGRVAKQVLSQLSGGVRTHSGANVRLSAAPAHAISRAGFVFQTARRFERQQFLQQ